ncbi:MAG: peptide-methionine (R)-S-oxide reductase MsrB [Bacteroidales bacterium]
MKIFLLNNLLLLMVIITGCAQNPHDMDRKKNNLRENDPGEYPITKSEAEWKSQLKPMEFEVLRQAGTERPFTGETYATDKPGIYFSAASGQPLFVSDAKYDAGCGWPSFFEPIVDDAVYYRTDKKLGMIRTEIIDASTGSHLGHVFEDGPPPTGLRYCLNSAAMLFVEAGQPWPPLVEEYMNQHASQEEKQAVEDYMRQAGQ